MVVASTAADYLIHNIVAFEAQIYHFREVHQRFGEKKIIIIIIISLSII